MKNPPWHGIAANESVVGIQKVAHLGFEAQLVAKGVAQSQVDQGKAIHVGHVF